MPSRSKTRLGGHPSSRLTTPMIDVRRSSTSHRNRSKNIFGTNTGMRHHQLRDRLSRDHATTTKYPCRGVDGDFGMNSSNGREMLKTPNSSPFYTKCTLGTRGGGTPAPSM